MVKDVVRLLGGLVAIPLSALGLALHRLANGPEAVLELRIAEIEDVGARYQILKRLRRVAGDPTVAALLLRIDKAPGSWAACHDLRRVLVQVRNAGKRVYVFVEAPGNAAMWIASVADRVFLVPMSQVGLVGVGVELTFMGDALRRMGVEPDFEAAGAYKSFGEPYTRTHASRANQEAVRVLVEDIHAQLVEGIAEGRDLSSEVVAGLLEMAPLAAEEALEHGLIDQLAYEDEVRTWVEQEHGDRARFQKFALWARRDLVLDWLEHQGNADKQIAVVHLQGPIVMDDRSPAHMVRARQLLPVLKHLRESDEVEAVVLHVNSPGGSALASDLIWREVDLLRREKPVVASFEDVAASGGYYLAAPAAEILARPASLTGSIGVFGGKLVMGETLRKVGVHTQTVSMAPNANVFSATRPFTDEQRSRFKASLQRFYDGFVTRVATGRKKPEDEIEPHCRGRVWTGRLAIERGLVDRAGDLFDAVERARVLAGLPVGGFREMDVFAGPARNLMARLMAMAMREMRPRLGDGALTRVLGVAERAAAGLLTPMVDVVLTHAGEPLAMLPFDIKPR